MVRLCLSAAVLLTIVASAAWSQDARAVAGPQPALGLMLVRVPEAVYSHLPHAPKGQGLMVEKVLSRSAGSLLGLQVHDIVLTCNGKPIQSEAHLVKLLRSQETKKVPLEIIRRGRPMTLQVALPTVQASSLPKGLGKPGGPPAVTVEAQPLDSGKLNVTFIYFSDLTGKQERVTCTGTLPEIEKRVRDLGEHRQMPARVQNLVDVALDRIRLLNRHSQEP